jgi:microcin C transport system substrate-binding protein
MMRSIGMVLALLLPCAAATLPAWAEAPTAFPAVAAQPAASEEAAPARTDAIALYGAPALPPGFKYFPYVNPNAPQGGDVVLGGLGSFDSFNPFVLRGTAAPEIDEIYDTLLRRSAEEAGVAYGHLARAVVISPDRRSITFELRPEAKFNDGTPVTAEDVAWTFTMLRDKGRPNYKQYFNDVADVSVEGQTRVVFHLKSSENRELPFVLGGLAILPKHWWAGRDFSQPLTEAPLGSGPYRLDHFELSRDTVLARVPDYWARDLPTGKGLANFGTIRTEYYRDATVLLEAFKAGRIDYRRENIAKNWATAYDFPAVQSGLVKKVQFAQHLPTGMQGYFMNTRRAVFADRRVRQAMDEVFDFQWLDKNLFYDQYVRTESYFSNSDMASSGLPQGDELALLSQYRDKLPPELFTQEYKLPETDGSGNNRHGLRAALKLLNEAGWEIKDLKLVNAAGDQMSFEILSDDPTIERVAVPYVQWLARLGIAARVRTVDPAQWQKLTDSFDFDMAMLVLPEREFPGNEQRDYWTCASGKEEGSDNISGICDPVVDALVDKIISAPDLKTITTATRALDRTLLWGWYTVPNWHTEKLNVAFWNRFGYPSAPVRSGTVFDSWWVDPTLSAATDAARRAGP